MRGPAPPRRGDDLGAPGYSLTEIEPLEEPVTATRDRTGWLDPAQPPQCRGLGCPVLRLHFNRSLPPGQTFVLKISRFTGDDRDVTVRFVVPAPAPPSPPQKAVIAAGGDTTRQSSELQLISEFPVDVEPTIKVHRVFYRVSADGKTIEKDTDQFVAEVEQTDTQKRRYDLKLDGKLVEGQEHTLFVDAGVKNAATKEPVAAEGKVKVAGIPTKPEELRVDFSTGSNAAVHQRPIFELGIKYKDSKPLNEMAWLPGLLSKTEWLWEPSVTVDVGLRSTKSANSVVLSPLNLSHVFLENSTFFDSCKLRPETAPSLGRRTPGAPPNSYSEWLRTPWYCPSDIKLTVGPKAEFDRNFKRKNVLGSLRFELNFERWLGSISKRRYLIEQSFKSQPKDGTDNVRLNYGLSIVPFVAFDFGGHVKNETVKKKVGDKELSVLVPRHRIFRSYLGFNSTFEVNKLPMPMTLTIEEWLVHLAARETIGFTTDDGAFLKPLRGFHHRGKATLAFAIDPSKHYNLTIEFENGRQAPNFEYLNKITTGVKIQY